MDLVDLKYMAAMASKAYDPPEDAISIFDRNGENRGFMNEEDGSLIVAISGTKSLTDVLIDGDVVKEHVKKIHRDAGAMRKHIRRGYVHAGFYEEYLDIKDQIDKFVDWHPGTHVRITGHSLGGAIAVHAAEHFETHGRDVSLLTLGCPAPGDADFAHHFEMLSIDHVRMVHAYDIVPRVPKIGYSQLEGLFHLGRNGCEMKPPSGPLSVAARIAGIAWADLTGRALKDHFKEGYIVAFNSFLSLLKGGVK